jgi:oligosaccharide repeat unit polymerase
MPQFLHLDRVPFFQWAVSFVVIFFFVYSYCSKLLLKRRYLDFYHLFLFVYVIFPLFVVPFFAYDSANFDYVGPNIAGIIERMPEAFAVSAMGSAILLIVSSSWADQFIRRPLALIQFNTKAMATVLAAKPLVILGAVTCIGLVVVEATSIFVFGGKPFNLRGEALADDRIRPAFNLFAVTLAPIVLFASTIAWLKWRRPKYLAVVICIAALESISGSRGSLLVPFLDVIFVLVQRRRHRIRLSVVAGGCIAIILLAFGLGQLRVETDPMATQSDSTFYDELVHGNNFSDVRDFAWVLSRWDGQKPWGQTYLAGALGFLPRSIVPFRQDYALSLYLNRFLGFEEDTHAGLRPGPFGEAYINFGWAGAAIMGVVLGLILGDIRFKLDKLVAYGVEDVSILGAQLGSLFFFEAVIASGGFWTFYVFLLAALSSKVISFLFYPKKQKIPRRAKFAQQALAAHRLPVKSEDLPLTV